MNNIKFGFVLLIIITAVIWMSAFIVGEKELAIKFKLGEIVESDFAPGLYFQVPILNNVRKFDSRILTLDTPSERYQRKEKRDRQLIRQVAYFRSQDLLHRHQWR